MKRARKKKLVNLNMLLNGRNDVINFIEGYSSMILEAKIITPKQMLQILLIALAQ